MPACGRPRRARARALEHRRDRGLVVGAEDRAAGVAHDAVLDDAARSAPRRHRVEVGAEEDRRPLARSARAGGEVAHRRADARARVVLVDARARGREVGAHAVGDGALLPRRARHRGQLGEEIESRHTAILRRRRYARGVATGRRSAEIALALPEAEEVQATGRAFRVRGKRFAWKSRERDGGTLAIRVDRDEKR